MRQALHEELGGISERYREPLLLGYLEGNMHQRADDGPDEGYRSAGAVWSAEPKAALPGRGITDRRRTAADRRERHLTFRVKQETASLRAVAFGMGDRAQALMSDSGRCCLAFTPMLNKWMGNRSVELQVVDFQPGPEAHLA